MDSDNKTDSRPVVKILVLPTEDVGQHFIGKTVP